MKDRSAMDRKGIKRSATVSVSTGNGAGDTALALVEIYESIEREYRAAMSTQATTTVGSST